MVRGRVPGVAGQVPVVGCLVTFVGQAFALGREPLTFVGEPVAFVGDPFTFVGIGFTLVGEPLTFVGDPVAFVSGPAAFVSDPFALLGVHGPQFDELAVGLGSEMTELGLQSPVDLGPGAVSFGMFAIKGCPVPFPDAACAVMAGLGALLGRTLPQLRDERPLVGGSLAQIVCDLLRLGHFGRLCAVGSTAAA